MPKIGIGLSIVSGVINALAAVVPPITYVTDKLKLYFNFAKESESDESILGANAAYTGHKEVQFASAGSTSFDGSGDYIYKAVSNFEASSSQGTISAWIKTSTTGGRIFTSSAEDVDDKYIGLIVHLDKFYIQTSVCSNLIGGGTTITDGAWHHLVATSNGSSYTLYVDGISETLTVTSGSNDGDWFDESPTQRDNITIGVMKRNAGLDGDFTGSIANVGIWSRALSVEEIQAIMHKQYADFNTIEKQSLVSWYNLDTNYEDSAGSNDGTNTGSTINSTVYGGNAPKLPRSIDVATETFGDAIGNGSYKFNGSSDYIILTEGDDWDIFTGTFSIAFWMRKNGDQPSYTTIIARNQDGGSYPGWTVDFENGSEKLGMVKMYDGSSGVFTTSDVPSGEWHHYTFLYDGTKLHAYVDGYLDNSYTGIPWSEATDEAIYIGAEKYSGVSRFFNGDLSQMGIWSRNLSGVEINSIMEKTYSELTTAEKVDLKSWHGLDTEPIDALNFAGAASGTDLDGTDNKMVIFDDIEMGTSDRTLAVWVQGDWLRSHANFFVQRSSDSNTNGMWGMGCSSAGWSHILYDGSWQAPYDITGSNDGAWHLLVTTMETSGSDVAVKNYQDGVLKTSPTLSSKQFYDIDSSNTLRLGGNSGTYYYDGKMTRAAVWKSALTATNVSDMYNLGVDGNMGSIGTPEGYWDLTNPISRMSFDGVNDYVEISDAADTLSGFDEITIMLWLNRSSTSGTQCPFDKDFATGWGINLYGSSQIHVWMKDTTGAEMMECPEGIAADGWHLLTITYTSAGSGTGKVYIDDSVELTDTPYMGATLTNNTAIPLAFGRRYFGSGSNYFNGKISQGAIWNKELTAGEVSGLYALGVDGDWTTTQASNLKGNWKLNHATTIQDLTAHNHDGTVSGATLAPTEVSDSSANSNTGTVIGSTLSATTTLDSTSNNNDGALH